jgi:hypothetical protein
MSIYAIGLLAVLVVLAAAVLGVALAVIATWADEVIDHD